MSCNPKSTLLELDGMPAGTEDLDSNLAERIAALYRKPLGELTIEDMRLLIGQEVGLKCLLPMAINEIERNPLAEGDYYPGDLLMSLLTISADLWDQYPDSYWRIYEVVAGLVGIFRDLTEAIERFEVQNHEAKECER